MPRKYISLRLHFREYYWWKEKKGLWKGSTTMNKCLRKQYLLEQRLQDEGTVKLCSLKITISKMIDSPFKINAWKIAPHTLFFLLELKSVPFYMNFVCDVVIPESLNMIMLYPGSWRAWWWEYGSLVAFSFLFLTVSSITTLSKMSDFVKFALLRVRFTVRRKKISSSAECNTHHTVNLKLEIFQLAVFNFSLPSRLERQWSEARDTRF